MVTEEARGRYDDSDGTTDGWKFLSVALLAIKIRQISGVGGYSRGHKRKQNLLGETNTSPCYIHWTSHITRWYPQEKGQPLDEYTGDGTSVEMAGRDWRQTT